MSVHMPSNVSSAADPSHLTDARKIDATATVDDVTVRRHADLATIAPLWRELEEEGTATAFQRLAWVSRLIEDLAAASRAVPIFIEVIDAETGQPLMLAPLASIRYRGHSVITWLDLGVCDYAAPLLAPGIDLTATRMAAIWRAIRLVLPRSDLIRISRIPAHIQTRPNPLASLASCRRMTMQASGIAIDGDAGTLLDRLCRPSVRKDMAKLRRRLERRGKVVFTHASTPVQVDTIFDALVEQRRSRFGEMGRFDLLSRPEVEAFYRASAHDGLAGGPARLFGLSVDGTWIAATYGLVHADTCHGVLVAMAGGSWRNTSPGLQILADCMRWARANGLNYFDFSIGVMPYKEDFGVHTRDLGEVIDVVTLRGFVVNQSLQSLERAKDWLSQHPAWFTKLQKARRWIRRRF